MLRLHAGDLERHAERRARLVRGHVLPLPDAEVVASRLTDGEVEQRLVVQVDQRREGGPRQDLPAVADDLQVGLRHVRVAHDRGDAPLEGEADRGRAGVGEGDRLLDDPAGHDVLELREEAVDAVRLHREAGVAVLDEDGAALGLALRARGELGHEEDGRGGDQDERDDGDQLARVALRGVARPVGGRGAFGHGSTFQAFL